jgi:hypothetical protein
VVRARTGPFDPMAVTREYVALCKQYHVSSVTGDRYRKRRVQQASRDLLGTYHESSLYAWQLYLEALPLFNRGLVELPDLPHSGARVQIAAAPAGPARNRLSIRAAVMTI